jgi:hypothetical protein
MFQISEKDSCGFFILMDYWNDARLAGEAGNDGIACPQEWNGGGIACPQEWIDAVLQ